MAEIIVAWLLAFIVLAIAWGWMDRMTLWMKTRMQSLQPLKPSRRLEIIGASLLAVAVFSIMTVVTDQGVFRRGEWGSLPTLLVWAGGLWLVPFRLEAVEQYWPLSLVTVAILGLLWVRSTVHTSIRTSMSMQVKQQDALTQQGVETPTNVNGGLGVLFWVLLIGLTVAVITRYSTTANVVALNS